MDKKNEQTKFPIRERLSDEEYKKIRAFEREMNAKDYTRHHRRKKS